MTPLHTSKRWTTFLAGWAVWITSAAAIAGPNAGTPSTAPNVPLAGAPDGVDEGWLAGVEADIRRMEYEASETEAGLQAPNRRHNLRTYFRPDGIDIRQRVGAGSAWRFTWRTLTWGRPGRMAALDRTSPIANGARVTYVRGPLDEWYVNGESGIEQGFTIRERPDGSGPLVITASVAARDGSPRLEVRADASRGGVDVRTSTGVRVLRYDALHVEDATRRALEGRIEVNGDHISIVVADVDAVYPIHIDPLITSSGWEFETEPGQGGALYATAVSTAGDVNGDGYSDIIIGAPDYDTGASDVGKVYVHHGSPDGPSAAADWTAQGSVAVTYLGNAVSTAGDVNGDGYGDIVVGAKRHSIGEVLEGMVLVWHGSASGLGPSGTLGNADWSVEGDTPFAEFGESVAWAGDVNGDGYDDIVAGSRQHTDGFVREGRASVYFGSATGVTTAGAWHGFGLQAEAAFGASVRGAGDVNGDGYDDVMIGAPGIEAGGDVLGEAYVWFGSALGPAAFTTPAAADWKASDGLADTGYGRVVAGVGDVNGDGYADVLVGAPYADNAGTEQGIVFLYPGTVGGPSLLPTWQWSSVEDGSHFGGSAGTAGDVNGDGFADVVVGAAQADGPVLGNVGAAYVFEGGANGLSTVPSSTVFGDVPIASFATSVGAAGDVNGDGFGDVIVGQPFLDGRAVVYPGQPTGVATAHAFQFGAAEVGAATGFSVASAGDVNGDGYSDVIAGAPNFDNGDVDEGIAGVYLGTVDGLTNTGFWLAEANQANARFGWDVGSAGDVNGDGYSDVIVGARTYSDTEFMEGAAFVWHGSPAGLGATGTPANADWSALGGDHAAYLGTSVASAGDIDGDGIGDVIVGLPGRNEVRVYHGVLGSGLPSSADWSVKDNVSGSEFGHAVAGAGDVNRDGYGDVVVGAPQRTDDVVAEDGEGWAFLWYGGPDGLGPQLITSADWMAESDQAFASLGVAVASAGDVNGDGCADIIVGAHGFDDGQLDEGAAFVWFGSTSGLGHGGSVASADWSVESNQPGAALGFSVDGVGDVDLDGYGDVVVGSWGYTDTQPGEGAVFLYLGSKTGPSPAPDWSVSPGEAAAGFGWCVSDAGDVNGDGFADLLVGAPAWNAGSFVGGLVRVFHGAGGGGMNRPVIQQRTDATAPIHTLGVSDSQTTMRFLGLARTPAGRARVRLEWEIRLLGVPFDGIGLGQSPAFLDTGPPVVGEGCAIYLGGIVGGLTPGFPYRWRIRFLSDSPYFPHTPWMTLPSRPWTEIALRMDGRPVSSPETADTSPAVAPALGVTPNPTASLAAIAFELTRGGHVIVTIHDVRGRLVARPVDGFEMAGRHDVLWDGRSREGRRVAPGAYFVRLTTDAGTATQKVIVAR